MRALVLAAVMLAGCVPLSRQGPVLTAELAVMTARELVILSSAPAPPDDEPQPGDTCPNCEGRGVVGDGNGIEVPCQPCNGGGKVLGSVLALPVAEGDCLNGGCSL